LKNNLEFLLESKGISKSQLAKEIGVTRQTIIRVVKGYSPSMEIGMKIAKYFGKDVSDVFLSRDVKHVARNNKGVS
jgi:putative transcriptional regulator